MKRTFVVITFLLLSFNLIGQNIHSSLNYFHPLLNSPAETGDIEDGNIRVGTSFRNQAFTITPNSYRTYFAYADYKFESLRKIKYDRIGVGLIVLSDQAGNGQFTTNQIGLNMAYHFHFNSFLSDISIGSRVGFSSRHFGKFGNLIFEEDLVGNGFSEDARIMKNNYFDLSFGSVFNFRLNYVSDLKLGFSINNIELGEDKDKEIPSFGMQYTFFSKANYRLSETFSLLPSIYYIQNRKNKNIQIQSLVSYDFNNSTFKAGIGYRHKDAIQALIGVKIKTLDIGLAYDVNISDLNNVSGLASGLEVGVKYVFTQQFHKNKMKRYISDLFSKRHTSIYKQEKIRLKKVELDTISRKKITKTIIVKKEETIKLNNILFDFDDDKILKDAENDLRKLLFLLNKYDDMVIELSSHTDSRGEKKYNLLLSQRRAESSKKWLVDRGIDPKRIIAKGYGESRLLNHCKDNVECTEEEHRVNRRTEFKIIAGPKKVSWQIQL